MLTAKCLLGRNSPATHDRARRNSIKLVASDVELCITSDYVISIVPPRDALAIAKRIVVASTDRGCGPRSQPLCFVDLNAISPKSAREIAELFAKEAPEVRYIDGGIIGGPPQIRDDGSWSVPKVPVSGPHMLSEAQPGGAELAQVLNVNHLNSAIGSATGLKMCFAALSKGFTALAIQSFTTAHNLQVLPELKEHLEWLNPASLKTAERGLVGMPPKAYRWVKEMEEIAATFETDGGFSAAESPFRGIAGVYELVAYGTALGEEKTESRAQGTTSDDVARLMAEGTRRRKEKAE